MLVGGLVVVLMLWSIIRHRRKGDEIPVQTQYHLPLEITYTVVPILIVLGLFAATLVVENKVVANPSTSVVVDVNAFQWGWEFLYPGHNAVVYGQTTQSPIMVVPAGENIHVNLTATDVIHGFYVHDFNFSRFALPGVTNQFTFLAQNTGTFSGQCTQLCGLYHALMVFRVKVVTPAQYQTWLDSFNTPADQQKAQAAAAALQQQLSTGVPTKPANTKFGR